MKNAYIFYGPKDGEQLERADLRLRDALHKVAGERDHKIENAISHRTSAIAGCTRFDFAGKAVVVPENEAEGLARSLADTMGCKHWLEPHTPNFQIGGRELGGEVGKPAAMVFVLS